MTAIETVQTSFDIAPLLAPIPGPKPAGEWLHFDPLYAEIRALRESDDPALPQGVWKRELKRADWKAVAEKASQALSTRSKDLQLAVWLTEAWLHLGGFPGFTGGMRLIAALCRDFWDGLYPPLDDGSSEARLAPVGWAAAKLLLPLKSVAVTAPKPQESVPLTWDDREHALFYDNLEKKHPAEAANAYREGAVSYAQFLRSASNTSSDFFKALSREVAAARAAVADVNTELAARAGASSSPSLTPLAELLEAIGAFASRVLAERVHGGEPDALPPDAAALPEAALPFDPFGDGMPLEPGPTIGSRAEAFQRLRDAADFLLRSEPHSPVPYLVLRAVSWEHLPLPELLAELLKKSDLAAVYALLGLQPEP